jgi:hypothetical protein
LKNDDLLDLIGKVDDKYIAELYDEDEAEVPAAKHSGAWKHWAGLAACLALIIVGGALWLGHGSGTPAAAPTAVVSPTPFPASAMSVVIMDVNPSMQFTLTPDGTVDSVEPLNDDAKAILTGVDLKCMGCAEAMKIVVSALESGGYLTNMKNSVLLTVVGKDDADTQQVREKVIASMEYASSDSSFGVSILSQVADKEQYQAQAQQYDISIGKAALIDKIVSGTDDYDYAELAKLNIHSLDQIMDYIGTDGVDRVGKVAGALADKVSSDLSISQLKPDEALDLAVALSDAYDEICKSNPLLDASTYTGYDFDLKQNKESDGSTSWTITAKNINDSKLPSVSIKLSKSLGLVNDDLLKVGASVVNDSVKLACDIFGLPDLLGN